MNEEVSSCLPCPICFSLSLTLAEVFVARNDKLKHIGHRKAYRKGYGQAIVPPACSGLPEVCRTVRSSHRFQQANQIFGMFFFHGEYPLKHTPGSWVIVTEVGDHFAIAINGNALRDQIFSDHIDKRIPFDVFRMTSREQS